jgi:hypothetical protein
MGWLLNPNNIWKCLPAQSLILGFANREDIHRLFSNRPIARGFRGSVCSSCTPASDRQDQGSAVEQLNDTRSALCDG